MFYPRVGMHKAGQVAVTHDAVCAILMLPMSAPPSPPLAARVTSPKGAIGSVPEELAHSARQSDTSLAIRHA